MPTEPLSNMLNRSAAIEQAKDVIDLASPLLQELVNKGTHIFQTIKDAAKDPKDTDFALLSLYYHVLEMTDGIQVHIANACAYPAIADLRSIFEALLSIRYLLQDPAEYEKRAFAWNVVLIHNDIKKNEKLDPTTDRGQKYYAVMKKQFNFLPDLSAPGSAAKKNQDLFTMLQQPNYQGAEVAYQAALKQKNRDYVDWYYLYDYSLKSLYQLAKKVDKEGHYETIYGLWSEIAHAENINRAWIKSEDTETVDLSLRSPKHRQKLAEVTALTTKFFVDVTYGVVEHFLPNEIQNLEKWGQLEIAENFHKIGQLAETL